MSAATKGAKAEWYRMPSDVEKVAICRLSGMRAGPRCNAAQTDTTREASLVDVAYPPASATPMVDSLTGSASYQPASLQPGAAIRTPPTRLFVERVPQSDGSIRTFIRQR